jgi:hypothetical protein
MTRIEVQTDDLSSLSTSLGQFTNTGNDVRTSLGAITVQQTGHGGLADAVSGFVHDWEFSLKKIGENAAAMAAKLKQAAYGYNQTEDAISAAASGSAPPAPAAADTP